MKITKLISENIKRISVVEITPDESLVIVGGKNESGKSSALDTIAYALGGKDLVPTQPIRKGQTEAKAVVELDDLIVTRKFRREKIVNDIGNPMLPAGEVHFGDVQSSLTVTNKDGARYSKPQDILNKLLGALTFDPLKFTTIDSKEQDQVLRKLVNLDVTPFDEARKAAAERRTMHKRSLVLAESRLEGLTRYPDTPETEVSMTEVSDAITRADGLRRIAERLAGEVHESEARIGEMQQLRSSRLQRIESLQTQITALEDEVKLFDANIQLKRQTLDEQLIGLEQGRAAVPNVEELRDKLASFEKTNQRVRANQTHALAQDAVFKLRASVAEEDTAVKAADAGKERALRDVKFPVEGLGLSDDGVLWEGLPLSEVSASVQLRVSVAIGLALNPTLKVLLIRNGNLLDDDSLKLVAAQAEAANAQIWLEYVSSDGEGVSVMLEDGHVKRSLEG